MTSRAVKTLLIRLVVLSLVFLALTTASASQCSSNLGDRADVANNPTGNDYDVYFTDDDSTSVDFCPRPRAEWVRDALLNSHDIFVSNTYNFNNPYFSVAPNDTCILDIGALGLANRSVINIDAPTAANAPEPFVRTTVLHELFHHVEYSYHVDPTGWPSWGGWAIEGTPASMEDKTFLDLDRDPFSAYVARVAACLATPNERLIDRSYDAALFWTYLCEQLGNRALPEPGRGVDLIQRFWLNTDGHTPDSVAYLRETIRSFAPDATFEDLFRNFCIANYTHVPYANALSDPDVYRYYDESPAGGGTPYGTVATQTVATWNTTYSSDVNNWGARYFQINVTADKQCQAVGFWGKSATGKRLSWALVGIRNGQAAKVYRSSGSTFYATLINPSSPSYSRLAGVVVGLNDADNFDYGFGSGTISGTIRSPTLNWMASAGTRAVPERFQVRLLLTGPAALTPPSSDPVSIMGLDLADFRIVLQSVATGAPYDAVLVSASYVSGEYWLVVQAPQITNALDGDLYDLKICYCSKGGSCVGEMVSPKSVLYAKITNNQVLLLDRSYSMHYPVGNSKLEAAKNAARLYVNAAANDDRLAFVTFSGNVTECDNDIDGKHYEVNLAYAQDVRANMISKIDSVNEDVPHQGWTSIGDGLKEGLNQLANANLAADRRTIVLLSDGQENEGDFWAKPNNACGSPAVRDIFPGNVRVDTVGFGSDCDQGLLQDIAVTTGGDFYYVSADAPTFEDYDAQSIRIAAADVVEWPSPEELSVANRLAQTYRSIEENLHNQQRLSFQAVRLAGGAGAEVKIPVNERAGGAVRQAVFAFNWDDPAATVKISLFSPTGVEITAGADWAILGDKTNKAYHGNQELEMGSWSARIESDRSVQVLCMLSGLSVHGVDMDVRFSQVPGQEKCDLERVSTYLRGLPVVILVDVKDDGGGIRQAVVEAAITNPRGLSNLLRLYDDGDHQDGLPGDGIYGAEYTRTSDFSSGGVPDFPAGPPMGPSGSYTVTVAALGKTHLGEDFQRYLIRSFHIFEYQNNKECDPDKDKDGLPDRWERLVGLNPADPSDAQKDSDGDGLSNTAEFLAGTLPLDPDTDHAGESDGSEAGRGADPLYLGDDALPPIIDYGVVTERIDIPIHAPQPNTNILHFPVSSSYQFMQIWRLTPPATTFEMVVRIDLKADPSGIYYDRGLQNDVTYSYYLVAEGLNGVVTAPTQVFKGTPRLTPIAQWKFDETTGTAASDSTGGKDPMLPGSNGVLYGGPVWQPTAGASGGALRFDGKDDYVSIPFVLDPASGPFSISAWVRGGVPGQVIISQQGGANWLMASTNTGALATSLKNPSRPGEALRSQAVITDGAWHQVMLVWDGKRLGLYVDGAQVVGNEEGGLASRRARLHIGSGSGLEAGSFWSGVIDDVQLFDRAVRGVEIIILPTPKPQLKAYQPEPADGSLGVTTPLFRWSPGETAAFHDVYIGTTPDLGPAQLVQPRSPMALFYYVVPLNPGTTYYWRVDEIEKDGRTIHTGDVWTFVTQALTANYPTPADRANDGAPTPTLTWLPGQNATRHHVYFGSNDQAVAAGAAAVDKGIVTSTSFAPGALEPLTTYYWRVDEIKVDGTAAPGPVWSFTTYLPVDDFERYTDKEGSEVFTAWIDGYATSRNGSKVGNDTAVNGTFGETEIVHNGKQSMPMDYNNLQSPWYSEAERRWTTAQNWTVGGADTLILYFEGKAANNRGPLYLVVEDSSGKTAVVVHPDPGAVKSDKWTQWKIPLSSLASVNLAKVKKLCIGVGDRTHPVAGGTGRIYIDDIRVTRP